MLIALIIIMGLFTIILWFINISLHRENKELYHEYLSEVQENSKNQIRIKNLLKHNSVLPDWSKAPEWARYFARDESGRGYYFGNIPVIKEKFKMWDDDNGGYSECDCYLNWRESLQKRPEGE